MTAFLAGERRGACSSCAKVATIAGYLVAVAERGLVKGERIGVDGWTMEANAALRSIMRRDSGESYRESAGSQRSSKSNDKAFETLHPLPNAAMRKEACCRYSVRTQSHDAVIAPSSSTCWKNRYKRREPFCSRSLRHTPPIATGKSSRMISTVSHANVLPLLRTAGCVWIPPRASRAVVAQRDPSLPELVLPQLSPCLIQLRPIEDGGPQFYACANQCLTAPPAPPRCGKLIPSIHLKTRGSQ